MSLLIFDTDHVSLILRGNSSVRARRENFSAQTYTTIITVQEIFNGWVGELNRPNSKPDTIVDQYHRLFMAIELFKGLPIFEFDRSALNQYEDLLVQNPDLRKKDYKKIYGLLRSPYLGMR